MAGDTQSSPRPRNLRFGDLHENLGLTNAEHIKAAKTKYLSAIQMKVYEALSDSEKAALFKRLESPEAAAEIKNRGNALQQQLEKSDGDFLREMAGQLKKEFNEERGQQLFDAATKDISIGKFIEEEQKKEPAKVKSAKTELVANTQAADRLHEFGSGKSLSSADALTKPAKPLHPQSTPLQSTQAAAALIDAGLQTEGQKNSEALKQAREAALQLGTAAQIQNGREATRNKNPEIKAAGERLLEETKTMPDYARLSGMKPPELQADQKKLAGEVIKGAREAVEKGVTDPALKKGYDDLLGSIEKNAGVQAVSPQAAKAEQEKPAPVVGAAAKPSADSKSEPAPAEVSEKKKLTIKGADTKVAAWQQALNDYRKTKGDAEIQVDGGWGKETRKAYDKARGELGVKGKSGNMRDADEVINRLRKQGIKLQPENFEVDEKSAGVPNPDAAKAAAGSLQKPDIKRDPAAPQEPQGAPAGSKPQRNQQVEQSSRG